MPRRESHLHGLLLVDKPGLQQILAAEEHHAQHGDAQPRLYTSHDIVQIVRRSSGERRIGHTGTLDPLASGLLVLCLGQATRLVEYYQGHDKSYEAEVTLGQATDTYDAMGQVTATAPIPALTVDQINAALAQFRGEILQLPPIYSALKQGGESLHRKARRGEAVQVEPRPVTIHTLELLGFDAPDRIRLRVLCSAGTYIRSLAHDLGQALNCHAHLTALRRETVGEFTLTESTTLADIETAATAGRFAELLLPVGSHLQLPELSVDGDVATRLGQGQKVYLPADATVNCQAEADPIYSDPTDSYTIELAKIVDKHQRFLGIGRCLKQNRASGTDAAGATLWKAEKWMATESAT